MTRDEILYVNYIVDTAVTTTNIQLDRRLITGAIGSALRGRSKLRMMSVELRDLDYVEKAISAIESCIRKLCKDSHLTLKELLEDNHLRGRYSTEYLVEILKYDK